MPPKRTSWFGYLLATGLSLSLAACDYTPPPAPAPHLDASTAQQLFDRLDRLAAALEAIPRQTGTVAVPVEAVAERTPVSQPTNAVEARIAALEREVAMLRAHSSSSFAPPRSAPVLPLQANVVGQVKSQLASKDQALYLEVRRSLFGLTPQQALERFGMPSTVEAPNVYTRHWTWRVDQHYCVVTFIDGLATSIDHGPR